MADLEASTTAQLLRAGGAALARRDWVGDEPAVVIDWYGASNFAKGT